MYDVVLLATFQEMKKRFLMKKSRSFSTKACSVVEFFYWNKNDFMRL